MNEARSGDLEIAQRERCPEEHERDAGPEEEGPVGSERPLDEEGGESEAHHREAGAPGDRAVPTLHGRERKPQWQHEDSEDDQPRPGGGVSVTREAHEEECDEVEGNEREEDEGPDRNPLAGHPLVPRSAKVVAPEDIEPGPDQCEQQGDDEQGREVRQAKGSERKHDHIAAGHSRIEGGAHVAAPGGGLGVRRDGRWQVADGRDDVQTARPYGSEEDHDERRDHTDTERDDQAAEGEAYPQLEPQPLLRESSSPPPPSRRSHRCPRPGRPAPRPGRSPSPRPGTTRPGGGVSPPPRAQSPSPASAPPPA